MARHQRVQGERQRADAVSSGIGVKKGKSYASAHEGHVSKCRSGVARQPLFERYLYLLRPSCGHCFVIRLPTIHKYTSLHGRCRLVVRLIM